MKFYDEAKLEIKAGDGGKGCLSFRREKFAPLGGPDGGDGGDGGSVIFEATSRKQNLVDFQFNRFFNAKNGGSGKGAQKHGKNGDDCLIVVPVGTIVFDFETGEQLADLDEDGMRFVVAEGGIGGRGNTRFKSATNRAPRQHDTGRPGEEKIVRLELKLLADVGLVGFPNAGKSTIIAAVSAARPKIADYPFTTLTPNLGVVNISEGESYVVADIPGLIQGAAHGAGLGHQFLRHIERTRIIWHVLDLSDLDGRTPLDDYQKINAELAEFDPALLEKIQIVVANKTDLPEAAAKVEALEQEFGKLGMEFFAISAVARKGLKDLIYRTSALLGEIATPKEK